VYVLKPPRSGRRKIGRLGSFALPWGSSSLRGCLRYHNLFAGFKKKSGGKGRKREGKERKGRKGKNGEAY
jgi:hypothetical protein